jgi:hypothetical protein
MVQAKAKKKARVKEITELIDPKAQRKADREIQKYVMALDEKADERYAWVESILAVNDESIAEIIGWMVDELQAMEGPPKIVYNGRPYNAIKGETELLESIQRRNFAWVAMRCLVACAEWDIRIGNFKLPTKNCARCGTKVLKVTKKKKAVKKKRAK